MIILISKENGIIYLAMNLFSDDNNQDEVVSICKRMLLIYLKQEVNK